MNLKQVQHPSLASAQKNLRNLKLMAEIYMLCTRAQTLLDTSYVSDHSIDAWRGEFCCFLFERGGLELVRLITHQDVDGKNDSVPGC